MCCIKTKLNLPQNRGQNNNPPLHAGHPTARVYDDLRIVYSIYDLRIATIALRRFVYDFRLRAVSWPCEIAVENSCVVS